MRDRNAPLSAADLDALAWDKMDGLLPAVVQDAATRRGADARLHEPRRARRDARRAAASPSSAARSSGCGARARPAATACASSTVHADCDGDALLVLAEPDGPDLPPRHRQLLRRARPDGPGWLGRARRAIVADRAGGRSGGKLHRAPARRGPGADRPEGRRGRRRGRARRASAATRAGCAEEAADLLYHLAVLMEARGFGWEDVVAVLRQRHAAGHVRGRPDPRPLARTNERPYEELMHDRVARQVEEPEFEALAASIDHTPIATVITNPRLADNPIVAVNQPFCHLTGYSQERGARPQLPLPWRHGHRAEARSALARGSRGGSVSRWSRSPITAATARRSAMP